MTPILDRETLVQRLAEAGATLDPRVEADRPVPLAPLLVEEMLRDLRDATALAVADAT